MLKAFFDDSSTHEGSEVVVAGGLIGTLDQWEAFEADWFAKLAEPTQGNQSSGNSTSAPAARPTMSFGTTLRPRGTQSRTISGKS